MGWLGNAGNLFQGMGGGGQGGWGDIGQGIGGIASLFGGGTSNIPNIGKTNDYLSQMQGANDRYLQPYIGAGQNAMGTLQGQYNNLMNDPGAMMNKFGAGYQQSPGYQYNVDQATNASNNAAAAGGFIGSPQQQEYMAKQIGGLASQDYNQYLNNAMGLYGQGLQGMGNINNMGFQASGQAQQSMTDMLKNQANLAYEDAKNRAKQKNSTGGFWGGLGSALGGIGKIAGGLALL
jgi:hypothetical protein